MKAKPMSICVEVCEADEPTYTRCVALPGRQSGLGIDGHAKILWKETSDSACELCVSSDGELALYRPAGSVPVVVSRNGRILDAPEDKPVILLHDDQLTVAETLLRVHIHGEATVIEPPTPVQFSEAMKVAMRAATAVAFVGAATMVGGCKQGETAPPPQKEAIEVRDFPPVVFFEEDLPPSEPGTEAPQPEE